MRLVQAKIPDDLAEWVDDHFPHGYKQRFIEDCFTHLRSLVEGGSLPEPDVYAKLASQEAIKMFND